MNERSAFEPGATPAEAPASSYAGRTRYTQLEYEAVLANASIGIAFTRERRFFLCNPKFAEMFGWGAEELIGQPGEVVYPSRESYEALGRIAIPVLSAGRQLDVEWEMRRRDGSTFLARVIARGIGAAPAQQGTIWIAEDITERRRADEQVRRLAAEQQLILDNATVGIMFVRDRVIERCNRRLEEMTGAAPGELAGKSTRVLFASEEDWAEAGRIAYGETPPGGIHESEWRFRRQDGTTFLCRSRGRRIDSGGPGMEWIWSLEDVTLERQAGERVRQALAQQDLILENATVGISFVRRRIYERCNPRLEQMFGYAPGEMTGKSTAIVYPTEEEYREAEGELYRRLAEGGSCTEERRFRRRDGTPFWCKVIGRAIDPAQPHEGSIWIYEDVTAERASRESLERAVAERTAELREANRRLEAEIAERKHAESHAQHLADHDPLTGLPNRRLLEDRLTQALALSQRNRKLLAAMFVDLDRFKAINDSLGHAVGDALLKEVARRLVKQLRVGDTVCRIGGDEFVVVLPEIKRGADAANVAQKILETLSQPLTVDGREIHITPSIGISVFPDDGRDAGALIRNADAAMYHAKETGRANYQFFTERMNLAASRRLAMEKELRRALDEGELRLQYRPVTELATGIVAAHEALLCWQHPERGLVPLGEFAQLAEDTGLALGIGEWMLREACAWAARADSQARIGVDLAPRQLSDPQLAERVSRALKEAGLAPQRLELELSESALAQQPDAAQAALRRLKGIGVGIAIDHFGAGCSNVANLKRLPLDALKIDRALVAAASDDPESRVIVAAIAGLARSLGLKVIALGAESEAQKRFLQGCGCDFVQS